MTVADRGLHPARAGRRALPHRHRARAGAPIESARRGPRAGRRSTGTRACWPSATPARRTRTRSSTTTRTCRGWPGPGGTSRRRSATCATSASRSTAPRSLAAGHRAGRRRQRLGQAGRRLDRPGRRRPRAGLGSGGDGRRGRRRARGRRAGRRAHVRRGVGGGAGAGRRRLASSTAPDCPIDDIDEMARRGTALVPTMINIETFGGIAAQARSKFPGYAEHMLALRDRFPAVVAQRLRGRRADLRRHRRRRRHPRTGWPPRRCCCCTSRPACPRSTCWPPARGRARDWLGFPGLVEGGLADLVVYDEDPRRTCGSCRIPGGSSCGAG